MDSDLPIAAGDNGSQRAGKLPPRDSMVREVC